MSRPFHPKSRLRPQGSLGLKCLRANLKCQLVQARVLRLEMCLCRPFLLHQPGLTSGVPATCDFLQMPAIVRYLTQSVLEALGLSCPVLSAQRLGPKMSASALQQELPAPRHQQVLLNLNVAACCTAPCQPALAIGQVPCDTCVSD